MTNNLLFNLLKYIILMKVYYSAGVIPLSIYY